MELYPLRSRLIRQGDSIVDAIEASLLKRKILPRDKDVLAVGSKAVAIAEGRTRHLSEIKPTRRAVEIARRFSLPPPFVQVVMGEADTIYGGVRGALLTLKSGEATANAGVDQKNAPKGTVVLWPANPAHSARKLRDALVRRFGKKLGVAIVDSRVTPLRLGTIGLALGSSGFRPVVDLRGKPDLYGRPARITFQAVADGIAGAAHLVMGENRERIPFVLVRGAPIQYERSDPGISPRLRVKDCLYMSQVSPTLRSRLH